LRMTVQRPLTVVRADDRVTLFFQIVRDEFTCLFVVNYQDFNFTSLLIVFRSINMMRSASKSLDRIISAWGECRA